MRSFVANWSHSVDFPVDSSVMLGSNSDGSHFWRSRSRMAILPEISVSVRNPVVPVEVSYQIEGCVYYHVNWYIPF
jgi:hypothetical protein